MQKQRDTCAERNTAHVTGTILMRIAVVIDIAGRKSLRTQLNFILWLISRLLRGRQGIACLSCFGSDDAA